MKITLIPPFPTGEGGRGDRGQESKLKAGAAGDKEGKPPSIFHSGRANKCRRGSAPCGHHSGRDSRYRRGIKYGYPPTYYPYSA